MERGLTTSKHHGTGLRLPLYQSSISNFTYARYSSGGEVTDYGLRLGFNSRQGKKIVFSLFVQTGSEADPTYYPMDTGIFLKRPEPEAIGLPPRSRTSLRRGA